MDFLHVLKAKYEKDYKIVVEFDNGEIKEVDLKHSLRGPIFEPLKEIENFKRFKVNKDTRTIEWYNGADFAPEYLSDIGNEIKKSQAA